MGASVDPTSWSNVANDGVSSRKARSTFSAANGTDPIPRLPAHACAKLQIGWETTLGAGILHIGAMSSKATSGPKPVKSLAKNRWEFLMAYIMDIYRKPDGDRIIEAIWETALTFPIGWEINR
jgi:hypothetical protein